MKTRSHKSRILAAALVAATVASPESWAQFNKFKSKTRFKPQESRDSQPTNSETATNNFEENESNAQTFGSRPVKRPPPGEKESKYVQLNPETAFGPEIITSFDFPDTDILELTKHMQKLTGINLILDKDVKGKVSIMAPSAITVGDAWKAYLAALNMAGYTLVKSGEFYKVINARDVRYVPTSIYTGSYTPDTEAHVMKILALKNVDASEISRNFRPFMSRYGRIIDIKQTNTIIISDTGANINRLERLIKFLDVPGFEESLQIIPVENSSAQEIAKLLDEILRESGGGSRSSSRSGGRPNPRFSGNDKGSNISKIIAEPRTNSIIAMANAEGARQLKDLIEKLDVAGTSASGGRIHVHYLNFGNAEELAKTLSTLISGATPTGGASASARARAIRGRRGNDQDTIFTDEVKVTADKNNNALVVTASPTDWLTLKNVISKLDIPRDQVYVEGIFMETSLTKVRAFGVEYLGAYGAGNAQRGGFLAGGGLVDLLSGNPTSLSGFFVGGGDGGTVEIPNPAGGDPLKVNSVNGLIKAIATNTASNVLATPQILAMDNTEAEFEVGETVPVRNTTTATNGTTQTTVTNQEAKLSLKITPQINKVTRFVNLKINQTINAFKEGAADTSGNGQATTTRSAVTEVMVKDRDTIAMGGLLRDQEEVSFSKVPLLGDIPVLGWLFKNKSKTVRKVNLLMFLTPRILSPYDNEASSQTLATIERSTEKMKKAELEGKVPFEEEMTSLVEKVKIQNKQSGTPDNIYKKTNESEGIEGGSSNDETGIDSPDYQEILESIED